MSDFESTFRSSVDSASPGVGGGAPAPFPRLDGELHAGDLSLGDVARRFGTPVYVYDARRIRSNFLSFRETLAPLDPLLAYSVKANGNLAVLSLLARLGAGADVTSGGELIRALRAGIPSRKIVFAGVGKTAEEMEVALHEGIKAFHVESRGEMELLEQVARRSGSRAPLAIRLNPGVMATTPHEYTRTGHHGTKFGVPSAEALELYRHAAESEWLEPVGVDAHIGSQVADATPYFEAFEVLLELADRLVEDGLELDYLDLGGGFAPGHDGEPGFPLAELAHGVVPALQERNLQLVLEPGRSVVGDAGMLVTQVLYVKEQGEKTFVVTDAGMNDLLRPSHYGGFHRIEPVTLRPERPESAVDVVGPVCESGDFLARDRRLALPEPGELLAIGIAGAYGFTMASNYNGRPRPAEVLVDGHRDHLIREREGWDDLLRGERIPEDIADSAPGHAQDPPGTG